MMISAPAAAAAMTLVLSGMLVLYPAAMYGDDERRAERCARCYVLVAVMPGTDNSPRRTSRRAKNLCVKTWALANYLAARTDGGGTGERREWAATDIENQKN